MRRDRVTFVGYLTLGTFGWFVYGFGALLPQLGRDQGISRTLTAAHSVALSSGTLLAGLMTVPLVRRLTRRGTLVLGGTLLCTGIVVLVVGGHWPAVTVPAMLVAGTGGSLTVNTINPALTDHHGAHGAAVLSEGNAVAASAGLVAPLVVGAGVALGLTWRPAILLTVPLSLLAMLALTRHPAGERAFDAQLPARVRGVRPAPLPFAFWPATAMLMAFTAVEFCLTAWSADLLRTQVGFSAGAAAAGVSAVVGGMTVGRVATGTLARRRSPSALLAISLAFSLAGWALVFVAGTATTALTGLFVTGLGLSAQYPLSAGLVLTALASERDRASGALSIAVALSSGGGPLALGALADATSTHSAFLVVPVLLAVGAVLLAVVTYGPREPIPVT